MYVLISFSAKILAGEQQTYQALYNAPNSQLARFTKLETYMEFIEEFSYNVAPLPCSDEQDALYTTSNLRFLLMGYAFHDLQVQSNIVSGEL